MSLREQVELVVSGLLDAQKPYNSRVHGFTALRVGRNEVWKLTPECGGQSLFLKRFDSEGQFQRERTGIAVANDLAKANSSYIAPDVLLVNEDIPAIVTFEYCGQSLADILKDAFRLDRNPFHRHERIEFALRSVQQTVQWLRDFHAKSVNVEASPYDHSIAGVANRVVKKIERFERSATTSNRSFHKVLATAKAACLSAASRLSSGRPGLLFGDPTPGNIFVVDDRIGFIDFEDIGMGDLDRDWATLSGALIPSNGRWKRWTCSKLADSIRQLHLPLEKALFFRLEALLDWIRAQQSHPRKLKRRLSELESTIRLLSQIDSQSSKSRLEKRTTASFGH